MKLRDWIREAPNFPQPGINFKDLTPLLGYPPAFQAAVDWFSQQVTDAEAEAVAAVDARGFLFASAVAYELTLPLTLLRKSGKLPPEVVSVQYDLEYGPPTIMEARTDGVCNGRRVAIIDDLLATGGTAAAASKLVLEIGGHTVAQIFLIELAYLSGRQRIAEEQPECMINSRIVYR